MGTHAQYVKCNKIKCFYFFPRAVLTIIFKHVCLAGRQALFTLQGFIRRVCLLFQCMNLKWVYTSKDQLLAAVPVQHCSKALLMRCRLDHYIVATQF